MRTASVLNGRPSGQLNLIAGRLCLDFVNSVGARRMSRTGELSIRDEKLSDSLDLLAWARHASAMTGDESDKLERECLRSPRKTIAVFRRAIHLREALYRILCSILQKRAADPADIRTLDQELHRARTGERLTFSAGSFVWRWRQANPSLERVIWMVAQSAAELLAEGDLSRLRRCAGNDCGWIFEDTSRNRSRRWCDMRDCGNVAKVRRFRGKRRSQLRRRVKAK